MCRLATPETVGSNHATPFARIGILLAFSGFVFAQTPEWRRVAGVTLEAGLPGPASGPVERVWYSTDGLSLFVRTASGSIWRTDDGGDGWIAAPGAAAPAPDGALRRALDGRTIYETGEHLLMSADGGVNWRNRTRAGSRSLLGAPVDDLAVSPVDPLEIVAANRYGIWRSADGGLTWTGLNDALENLPVRRILETPSAGRAGRLELRGGREAWWLPGAGNGWIEEPGAGSVAGDVALRGALSRQFQAEVSHLAAGGAHAYVAVGGRLASSADRMRTWTFSTLAETGSIHALAIVRGEPAAALAVGRGGSAGRGRVLRTFNGGLFWDDVTANLPVGVIPSGVTADLESGMVYIASNAGAFSMTLDLRGGAGSSGWEPVAGLPPGAVADVRLDDGGHQLYAAIEGAGLFATLAPHRRTHPRMVSAADAAAGVTAAPGSLMTFLGGRIAGARSGDLDLPVLAAGDSQSQLQIPFTVAGEQLRLRLEQTTGAVVELALPLRDAAPVIFTDRDGAPLIIDADRGVLIEAGSGARAGSRVQILAAGLGRVNPVWPAGVPAPLNDPPRVDAKVDVLLDRSPVEVLRAVLAPGYVGLYLVEVQLPALVNEGPAELQLRVNGAESQRARLIVTLP